MPTKEQQRDGVPIMRLALARRISRERAIRLVLTGEVEGWQDERGRWFCSREALSDPVAA